MRWKKPEAVEPWSNIYVAETVHPTGIACMQRKTKSRADHYLSEDCLRLNVYTPG